MSLDSKIRHALKDRLADWRTGAKQVVTYCLGRLDPEDLPIIDVETGSWDQHVSGNENMRGRRLFTRTYDVHVHCVGNAQASEFAEQVNLIGDQVIRAFSQYDAIPGIRLDGLVCESAEYHPFTSEKGQMGSLTLMYRATVDVNESTPDVEVGSDTPSIFPFPA